MKLIYSICMLLIASQAPSGTHNSLNQHKNHNNHNMAVSNNEPDELGRRLYGMKHELTPEVSNELRRKIPLFNQYTDAQISMSMSMMGSNYAWYLSKPELKAKQGVLILLHGFRDGDQLFKQEIKNFTDIFPTAMAPGMSMMMSNHIQLAINDLESAGAEQIVIVPIVSTSHNTLMRQWEYIFGLEKEAPYASVAKITSKSEILFANPPGDNPLVAEILIDHALEISENPKEEVVIVVAHGPSFENDNKKVSEELLQLAKIMKEDSDFSDVQALTLQDDATPDIRKANVAQLREMVINASEAKKTVLVVTNLIGTRTIQSKLRKDLNKLDFKFNKKGLSEHPNFIDEWLGQTILEKFENNPI
ncbi:MAG: hypothetical protein VYA80_08640 [Pseudomonadota bacterium]|nr:hypothetical protein [Pseudomonadota bacterium]